MSAKRFSVEELNLVSDHLSTRFFIVDNENMSSYDVHHIVSDGFEVQFDSWAEKIADKLNELHEEKEMWKRECERLKGLYYLENENVELEDIIGLVKTDEPTNSVELKKELYK